MKNKPNGQGLFKWVLRISHLNSVSFIERPPNFINKENEIKVEVKDIQLGSGVGRAKTYLQILNPMLPHDATLLHLCMVRSL